jgi:hypothetical protein
MKLGAYPNQQWVIITPSQWVKLLHNSLKDSHTMWVTNR